MTEIIATTDLKVPSVELGPTGPVVKLPETTERFGVTFPSL